MPRNYKKEYKNYQGKPEQIEQRAARNKSRSEAMKSGKVKKGDGKDVHHKDGNPKNGSKSNLSVKSKSANRSFKRDSKGRGH